MQLIFLGTSSGTPTRRRNVSGLALSLRGGRDWILVDCGEGTQHRLLRTPLSTQRLQAICISHVHGDHCYGLPGLLASAQLNGRTAPLSLIGPASLWDYLQGVIASTALHLDFPLHFLDVDRVPAGLEIGGFGISAWPLSHRVPSFAFRFVEASVPLRLLSGRLERDGIPRGPLWGALQRGESVQLPDGLCVDGADYTRPAWRARSVVVGGDNDCPDLLGEACSDADLLVHEATYDEEIRVRIGPEPMHSSAARVAAFAERRGLPHLVLTHFSPRYQKGGGRGLPLARLEQEARERYSGDLWLAEDYDCFELDRNGRLQHSNLLR
ncbi:MBL fold metallo-hydrolase [Marinobacterium aestuariivivens]|uniref:Ribonuclease Z n=1 Tax=Marinobacterium aestuariivivens TaxID=1698799 RepID=A0ABW2A4H0_9GAMM